MLARGELQTIGATTLDEYRKHLEKDAALERRFQPIKVEEPTVAHTIEILKGLRDRYEAHHRVTITDQALVAAANLADRYISDRHLPDKAIDLIDEAGSRLRIRRMQTPPDYKELEDEIAERPQGEGSGDRGPAVRARPRACATRRRSCSSSRTAKESEMQGRGRRPLRRGRRGVDRRGPLAVDRHPRLQAHRGGDGQAPPHGGRAAQAGRRPGGRRSRRSRQAIRRTRAGLKDPKRPSGLVHLPRPVRRREDRAGQDARRVPVRRRERADPARHVASTWRSTRSAGSSARLPATSATRKAASSPRPCGASRSPSCCSTRSRRRTPTCSTRCCRSWRTVASPTRRAARSTSRTP